MKTSHELKLEAQDLFDRLKALDDEIYATALAIFKNPENYSDHKTAAELNDLLTSLNHLAALFSKTGDTAHYYLSSLHDLTKDEVHIYPFPHFKYEAANIVQELYGVSESILVLGMGRVEN